MVLKQHNTWYLELFTCDNRKQFLAFAFLNVNSDKMMFELMRTHVVCQLLKALSSTCVMEMKTETVRHVFITAQAVLRD